MQSLNRATLIGNLGRDAETTTTPSGVSVTKFSVATTSRFKSGDDWQERTHWHNVVLWRGENVAKYLTKGQRVYVEGRIESSSYEDRDGHKRFKTDIVCQPLGVMLLGSRGASNGSASSGPPPSAPQTNAYAVPRAAPADDEVPF